jgi:hypothetical protein
MPNPLAIGVTLAGLLLEIVVPRPKPRSGLTHEPSLLSTRAGTRTPWYPSGEGRHEGAPVAGEVRRRSGYAAASSSASPSNRTSGTLVG